MKQTSRLAALVLAAGILSGCGFQDGTYTAQTAGADSLGYRAYLTVTVTDGEISSAEFDALDAAGGKKTQNEEYGQLMQPICGTVPAEISEHYRQLLMGAKSYRKVKPDAISGATVSSGEFARLWASLRTPLKEGTPDTVTLPPAPEYVPPTPNE